MEKVDYPLSIRFIGPGLEDHGIPICNLGESLIALQRMIHKAYLIDLEKPFVHATLSQEDREKLALQVAGRDRHSDMYLLNWLSMDTVGSFPTALLTSLLTSLVEAMSIYAVKKVKEKLKQLKHHAKSRITTNKADLLALRIYNEMQQIVNHVDENSAIETIEIRIAGNKTPIILNSMSKEYIQSLDGTKVYGQKESIRGQVDKAHTLTRNCAEVVDNRDGKWVKVCMPSDLFENLIRDLANPSQNNFEFKGRAIFRVGKALHSYNEFEAEEYMPLRS